MLLTDPLCHTATLRIAADADTVFAFMADGLRLGEWSFGCWNTASQPDGLFRGTSLMSGEPSFVRIDADAARRQVDYAVGATATTLIPRVVARVIAAAHMEQPESVACFLTLIAWRGAGASDERWRQACALHEAEVFRIRHVIESEQ